MSSRANTADAMRGQRPPSMPNKRIDADPPSDSACLLSSGSGVRIPPGAPKKSRDTASRRDRPSRRTRLRMLEEVVDVLRPQRRLGRPVRAQVSVDRANHAGDVEPGLVEVAQLVLRGGDGAE